jgi:acid phosphatase type 7
VAFGRKWPLFLVCLGALLGAIPASAAGVFTRGPFLQSLGPNGVTVKVEMLTPEAVTVEITGPDGATKKIAAPDAKRFQAVRLDGLAPATAYRYKVIVGDKASEEGSFVTAPADSRPFTFIAYGDSRSDHEAHTAVIRSLRAVPSDFLIHTGDIVATGDEEDDWKAFFEVENSLLRDRCVFATIGNHELLGDKGVGAAAFMRYFACSDEQGKDRAKLYGTFRWSNTRFFLLNAMDDWAGEEREWLRGALDAAAKEPGLAHRIAILHHGPQSSGPHGGNPRLHKNGVMQIFRDGKVDLIIAGHDHVYERGTTEGVKYLLSGGAGAPIYPRKSSSPDTAMFESVHHFVEVNVDGDKVGIVARRASGSVLETCGFEGAGPWSCDKAKAAGATPAPASSPADVQKSSACACSSPGRVPAPGRAAGVGALGALVLGLCARRKTARGRATRPRS